MNETKIIQMIFVLLSEIMETIIISSVSENSNDYFNNNNNYGDKSNNKIQKINNLFRRRGLW